MAITYEEALATLEAMFGAPWTRGSLDAVLRHEKGHMENTCERILNHGDQDPQLLLDRLKSGHIEVSLDEELARQLQAQQQSSSSSSTTGRRRVTAAEAAAPAPKQGRGTPTELPKEFLRIPGYKHRSMIDGTGTATGSAAMDDETLARMLQDELFSEELARNPDFAHLARGARSGRTGASRTTGPPGQRRSGEEAPLPNPFEGVNVMENLSKLGEGARRRLQMFAVNFENRLNGRNPAGAGGGSGGAPTAGILQADSGAVAERRGLLDDDDGEEEIEFEMREKKSK